MIYFVVGRKDQGSAILRGVQISNELNILGYNSKVVTPSEIKNFKSKSIFFWIKNINLDLIRTNLKNGIHIYDVVDNYIYQKSQVENAINCGFLNQIIVNNEYMRSEIISKYNISQNLISVIHHHWDPRISTAILNNQSKLTFGFLGSVASLKHTDNLLHYMELINHYDIRFYDTENGQEVSKFIKNKKNIIVNRDLHAMANLKIHFNCHLSIRKNNTAESKYKTSAKVATAAALGHNILTTYEKATQDILPKDYPFILHKTDYDSVRKMFDLIITDYFDEKKLWKLGLEIMKQVKNKTSLSEIINNYLFILNNIK